MCKCLWNYFTRHFIVPAIKLKKNEEKTRTFKVIFHERSFLSLQSEINAEVEILGQNLAAEMLV